MTFNDFKGHRLFFKEEYILILSDFMKIFWLNQINNKEVIKYKANFSEGESERLPR